MTIVGMVVVLCGEDVAMKVIGNNGHNAGKLADEIRRYNGVPNHDQAFDMARRAQFGSIELLAVQTKNNTRYIGIESQPVSEKRFDDRFFNPQNDEGYATFIEFVKLQAPAS